MKKLIVCTLLGLAAVSASALELTVSAGRDFADINRGFGGITVGQSVGAATMSLGYQRTAVGTNDQNRFSLVGGYDVAKVGPVMITPMVGLAYVANKTSDNGVALTAGVELSMPVYKKVEAVLDYSYQLGQSRISSNGGRLAVGVRYPF